MKSKNLMILILILLSELVYSQEMNFAWSKITGTSGNNKGTSIISDKNGYLFVAGEFNADFIYNDNTITGLGQNNIFILKLDLAGNLIWSKCFGSNSNATIQQICFDTSMNVVCTGTFSGSLLLNDTAINSIGGSDIFILKIKNTGETMSVLTDGGTGNENSNALCVDKKNNIYVCGSFKGSATFGNQSLTSSAYWQYTPWGDSVYTYNENGFFAKYNSQNECLFAKQICKDRSDLYSIVSDTSDNIFTTGFFESYNDLKDTIATEIGNFLVFNYNSEGKLINLIQEGSNNNYIRGNSLAIDNENNVLIAGYIGCHNCVFGDSLLPLSYNDAFLVKYDNSGTMKWINLIGQYDGDYDGNENSGNSIIVDKYDNIILSGYFDAIESKDLVVIGNNSSIDFLIMKFNKNGSITNIGTHGYPSWDSGESVTIDTSNNIYFTGYTFLGAASNQYPSYVFIGRVDSMPTLGIESMEMHENITIYPNPTHGSFYVDLPGDGNKSAIISVSNVEGKIVLLKELPQKHNEIIIKDYKPGLYIIKIQVGYVIYSKKLLIE